MSTSRGCHISNSYHHPNLKQALLARAIEAIEADGVESLSLRSLSRDLGVSHAAPSRHFKTKADLLAALVEQGYTGLMKATALAGKQNAEDPVQRLRTMAQAYVTWAVEHPALHSVMRNPDVSKHASDALQQLLSEFAVRQIAAIASAQSTGWNADEDRQVLMFRIMACVVGASFVLTDPLYRQVIGRKQFKRIVDSMLDPLFA